MRLVLREYEQRPGVPLSANEVAALRAVAPSLAVQPAAGEPGRYDLTCGSHVGAVHVGDCDIVIRPKVGIRNLVFMLSYAADPKHWTSERFDLRAEPELYEAIVPAFTSCVRRALRRGVLQGYRTEEAALATIRGRLRFDDQLRYRYGHMPPVEVRFDEFTEDIEANRIIKAALRQLGRLRLRSTHSLRAIHAFDGVLASVRAVRYSPHSIPQVTYDRLNMHYRPAVELARLILGGAGFEIHHGSVEASAMLVDMNGLFEDFVATALREALQLDDRAFPRADGVPGLHLDDGRRLRLRPDLSWWREGRPVFVGDVKYKRSDNASARHADVYQLLAYMVATGLPRGLLIYAREPDGADAMGLLDTSYAIGVLGRRVDVVALDVCGTPEDMLAEIERLGARIRRTVQDGGHGAGAVERVASFG